MKPKLWVKLENQAWDIGLYDISICKFTSQNIKHGFNDHSVNVIYLLHECVINNNFFENKIYITYFIYPFVKHKLFDTFCFRHCLKFDEPLHDQHSEND